MSENGFTPKQKLLALQPYLAILGFFIGFFLARFIYGN